jgi:hypothetical protein
VLAVLAIQVYPAALTRLARSRLPARCSPTSDGPARSHRLRSSSTCGLTTWSIRPGSLRTTPGTRHKSEGPDPTCFPRLPRSRQRPDAVPSGPACHRSRSVPSIWMIPAPSVPPPSGRPPPCRRPGLSPPSRSSHRSTVLARQSAARSLRANGHKTSMAPTPTPGRVRRRHHGRIGSIGASMIWWWLRRNTSAISRSDPPEACNRRIAW